MEQHIDNITVDAITQPHRPPYKFVDGDVNLPWIYEQAGLDPRQYAKAEFMANTGIWALAELFSDGELRIIQGRQAVATPTVRKSDGSARFGEYYDKMSALRQQAAEDDGVLADEVNRLARFCGRVLAEAATNKAIQLPTQKIASPQLHALDAGLHILFGQYSWHAPRQPAVVLECGPGITGTRFLDLQIEALRRGVYPFQYVAVSDGPFINQFLLSYFSNRLTATYGPPAEPVATNGRFYIGREDGMSRATNELLATPQPSGTHEICDVVLMTGVYDAGPGELETAITNSFQLLRPLGKLMLSAPLTRHNDTMTLFPTQLQWAEEAGYVVDLHHVANTGDHSLGTNTRSGLAVLRKP